jgi:orotate phosphoribosyltransferase
MNYKRDFIEFMARAGAIAFGSFTTKSGRESPYVINTGSYRTGAQIARLGGFYAACIAENMRAGRISTKLNTLFGPAYKGIPLAVSAAISLSELGIEVNFCYNRKEAKDHGEGGDMVGYRLRDGDGVLITEDVLTAGTAVKECLPLLRRTADVSIEGLIVSVDRMERGDGGRSAIRELEDDYGLRVYPIVTARDIIDTLHNRSLDGVVFIDDAVRESMEAYLARYRPVL